MWVVTVESAPRSAFEALVSREVVAGVYRVLVRRGIPECNAPDVVQDTFVRAMKSYERGNFDPREGTFQEWLNGIARHVAATWWRARNRKREVEGVSIEDECVSLWPAGTPEDDVARRELLGKALGVLDPDEVDRFARYYLDGESAVEIAEREKVPEDTVRSRLRASVERLKDLLTRAGRKARRS